MKKYLRLIYNSIAATLTYRTNLIVSFGVIAFPFIIAVIFWKSIFFAHELVGNYSLKELITYYFLVLFLQDFVYPGLNYDIVMEIKNGNLNFILLKPLNYFLYAFFTRLGSSIAYLSVVLLFLIAYILIFGKLLIISIARLPALLLIFLCSYILSALISFFFSILTLYLENFAGLESFVNFIVPILSGYLLPINLLPSILQHIAAFLPFKLLLYSPIEIYLGRQEFNFKLISFYLLWIGAFSLIDLIVWKAGLKRYRAVGG